MGEMVESNSADDVSLNLTSLEDSKDDNPFAYNNVDDEFVASDDKLDNTGDVMTEWEKR